MTDNYRALDRFKEQAVFFTNVAFNMAEIPLE
jgi:hypothetical protein